MIPDISHAVLIEAPIGRVWEAITRENLVAEWLGCLGFSARIGAVFYMQPDAARREAGDITGATHCEIIELSPPHSIKFSWFVPDSPKTYVYITLEERGTSTLARLEHTGWKDLSGAEMARIREMLDGGWRSFVLPALKSAAEGLAH